MATENSVQIVGNLTDDPELRFTPSGTAVANMRVAVNRRIRNNDTGEWDDRLDGYFTVNVWREYAENAAESLQRGDRVLVIGRLLSRSFETREGETRWVTEIEADEICPSLRWAKARIEKVRGRPRDASQRSQGAAGGQSGGGQTAAPPSDTAPAPETDEVPF